MFEVENVAGSRQLMCLLMNCSLVMDGMLKGLTGFLPDCSPLLLWLLMFLLLRDFGMRACLPADCTQTLTVNPVPEVSADMLQINNPVCERR